MTAHHCHAINCPRPCPPRMLMCRVCWATVSPETQREVYRTVKLRDMSGCDATWAPWWRASHRAIYEAALAAGLDRAARPSGGPWNADAWLAHEMHVADELANEGV